MDENTQVYSVRDILTAHELNCVAIGDHAWGVSRVIENGDLFEIEYAVDTFAVIGGSQEAREWDGYTCWVEDRHGQRIDLEVR
jgi:hypothetical protein